ncbi:MAG TPA: TlpA disulfide reductase family protein [Candidatus Limnocylindrales bacterium]|nr:TlpA disulfide reductase family protein [Candidatus Limnocylindrales bacterium]
MTRFLFSLFLAAAAALAQPLTGLWDASIVSGGLRIPFRMEFSAEPSGAAQGSFFNGDEKVTSTSGRFSEGKLELRFDYYAATLTANLADGILTGQYVRAGRAVPFEAKPFVRPAAAPEAAPSIAGLWEVGVKSSKGEGAWRFIVRQSGAAVSAAILRVDGDTGTLEGVYHDGKFVLSHFDGARPAVLEVIPEKDGTLTVVQNGRERLTAVRATEAREKGLPLPADPSRHTSVKDPAAPLHFAGTDLNGVAVTDQDARFRGKVVVLAIGGSWCPNCHDEAPFLVELYRKYHARGLEIVALDFEEADQLQNPERLRAFIRKYGITYPVLLAGTPSELSAKLPQAVNLNAWPTTFFLGRDGRVRAVHAGFAGKASGEFHEQMREEVTALIERLLGEDSASSALPGR